MTGQTLQERNKRAHQEQQPSFSRARIEKRRMHLRLLDRVVRRTRSPGSSGRSKRITRTPACLTLPKLKEERMRRGGRRVGRSRPKVVRLSTSFESVEEESYNERTARGLRTNALCPTRGSLICEQSVDPSERLLGQPGCSRGREAARLVGTPEEGI